MHWDHTYFISMHDYMLKFCSVIGNPLVLKIPKMKVNQEHGHGVYVRFLRRKLKSQKFMKENSNNIHLYHSWGQLSVIPQGKNIYKVMALFA